MQPQFQHNCTADTLVGVLAGVADIYRHCSGFGYIVRIGNDGPDYESSCRWTFAEAINRAARIALAKQRS